MSKSVTVSVGTIEARSGKAKRVDIVQTNHSIRGQLGRKFGQYNTGWSVYAVDHGAHVAFDAFANSLKRIKGRPGRVPKVQSREDGFLLIEGEAARLVRNDGYAVTTNGTDEVYIFVE